MGAMEPIAIIVAVLILEAILLLATIAWLEHRCRWHEGKTNSRLAAIEASLTDIVGSNPEALRELEGREQAARARLYEKIEQVLGRVDQAYARKDALAEVVARLDKSELRLDRVQTMVLDEVRVVANDLSGMKTVLQLLAKHLRLPGSTATGEG